MISPEQLRAAETPVGDRRRRPRHAAGIADTVVVAAQAGAPWAFERLYEELAGTVHGYLSSQGARDAEDLTSDVFLRAFTNIRRFSGNAEQFRSWVFTIAHHRLVDDRRRQSRAPVQASLDEGAGPFEAMIAHGDVEADVLRTTGDERVVRLLERLVPDQRDVLLLRIVGGLTVEEVAAGVGKRPGAVKALQRRGIAALQRILDREGVTL